MFNSIDPSALSDPGFKEDAVREEIVAPLLRRLGYMPTGPLRVLRSKTLQHPFVRIGTTKHPVSIIPDYTLYSGEAAIAIVDAKAPWESVVKSAHVEQAFSYAIHPDVRCRYFALCNGRELAVYDVQAPAPLLVLPFERFESDWLQIERFLSARYLLNPQLRDFHLDLGIFLSRLGLKPNATFTFIGDRLSLLARMSEDGWTANASIELDSGTYVGSFDFPGVVVEQMLNCIPPPLRGETRRGLAKPPFQVSLDAMVEVDWTVRLGELVHVEHESLIPLTVIHFVGARFRAENASRVVDLPYGIFSLQKRFDELVAANKVEIPAPPSEGELERQRILATYREQIGALLAPLDASDVLVVADARDVVGRAFIEHVLSNDGAADDAAKAAAEANSLHFLCIPASELVDLLEEGHPVLTTKHAPMTEGDRMILVIAGDGMTFVVRGRRS